MNYCVEKSFNEIKDYMLSTYLLIPITERFDLDTRIQYKSGFSYYFTDIFIYLFPMFIQVGCYNCKTGSIVEEKFFESDDQPLDKLKEYIDSVLSPTTPTVSRHE